MKKLFPKCKNPLVEDNLKNRFNEWLCGTNRGFINCITVGSYSGMQQALCKRCGHRNYCGAKDLPEWTLPDRLQTK